MSFGTELSKYTSYQAMACTIQTTRMVEAQSVAIQVHAYNAQRTAISRVLNWLEHSIGYPRNGSTKCMVEWIIRMFHHPTSLTPPPCGQMSKLVVGVHSKLLASYTCIRVHVQRQCAFLLRH